MESKEKRCNPFKKHSERVGWRGPQSVSKREIPLGDRPSPQAEFLQPAGPFSSTRGCGVCGAVDLLEAAPPLSNPALLLGQKGQCCPNKAIGSQKLLPK